MKTLKVIQKIATTFIFLVTLSGCFQKESNKNTQPSTPVLDALAQAGCTVARLANGVQLSCNGTSADLLDGAVGPAGGTSLYYKNYSFATGTVKLAVLANNQTDVDNISVAKLNDSVTISNVSGSAKLKSIVTNFDAADVTQGWVTIYYPEISGGQSLADTFFPTLVRFSAAGAQQTTAFLVENTAGTVKLTASGLTNSAASHIKITF